MTYSSRRLPVMRAHLLSIIKTMIPAFLVCTIWVACSRQDDGESIRALIAEGAALAEAHDITGILDLASEDVRAMPMDLNRRSIKGVLWRTFNYYGPLQILYPRPFVEVNDSSASAKLAFLIVKKGQKIPDLKSLRDDPMAWIDALGDRADLYRMNLILIKKDGDWVVNRAILERFTGMGFD